MTSSSWSEQKVKAESVEPIQAQDNADEDDLNVDIFASKIEPKVEEEPKKEEEVEEDEDAEEEQRDAEKLKMVSALAERIR